MEGRGKVPNKPITTSDEDVTLELAAFCEITADLVVSLVYLINITKHPIHNRCLITGIRHSITPRDKEKKKVTYSPHRHAHNNSANTQFHNTDRTNTVLRQNM